MLWWVIKQISHQFKPYLFHSWKNQHPHSSPHDHCTWHHNSMWCSLMFALHNFYYSLFYNNCCLYLGSRELQKHVIINTMHKYSTACSKVHECNPCSPKRAWKMLTVTVVCGYYIFTAWSILIALHITKAGVCSMLYCTVCCTTLAACVDVGGLMCSTTQGIWGCSWSWKHKKQGCHQQSTYSQTPYDESLPEHLLSGLITAPEYFIQRTVSLWVSCMKWNPDAHHRPTLSSTMATNT